MSGAWLERLVERPWRGMADIALPKFDFDSEHDLKSMLISMGMTAPFNGLVANFRGIASGSLSITTAIQKANVTVDEEGTEAAADRPFLFLIRETSTGLILFVGRVMKPVPPQVNASGKNLK